MIIITGANWPLATRRRMVAAWKHMQKPGSAMSI